MERGRMPLDVGCLDGIGDLEGDRVGHGGQVFGWELRGFTPGSARSGQLALMACLDTCISGAKDAQVASWSQYIIGSPHFFWST